MRITHSTIMRNYNRNLSRLAVERNKCENRITSTRQFSRASESPLKAAKALSVRKQLDDCTTYKENLSVANKFYTEAETSLLQISEQLAAVRETIIYAANSGKDPAVDLGILAQQLEAKAVEMHEVFNTNSAERAIFGGESNSPKPFEVLQDDEGHFSTLTYHGIPIDAFGDSKAFPYSNDVFADIGLGMVVDQSTHEIDPQTALKISFNGASISGCGSEECSVSVDLTKLEAGKSYKIDIYANDQKKTISFTGNDPADINAALAKAFKNYNGDPIPTMDANGKITCGDKTVYATANPDSLNKVEFENNKGFSKNYIQLTLDCAAALRDGDIEYANACIDRIVSASENLLVEIADLGCQEEFIEFNNDKIDTRELNLKERQKDLEATDLESEITMQKMYEALYNACLQMSSKVIPNSIFNYIS